MLGSARATFVGASAPVDAVVSARTPLTVTAGDDAQIGTGEAKFGVSSGFMNANDYISATSDNFIFSGDFTIEFFGNLQGTNTGNMIRIGNVADTWASGVLRLRMSSGNVAVESYDGISITSTISSFDYTWRHWAIVRSGSTVTLYKDGVSQGTDTDSNTIGTTTYNQMVFGYGSWGSWAGYVDEIRVSNNARYTSNFTPTTSAFENDANTVILLHMDGANASTTFLDDAGTTFRADTYASNVVLAVPFDNSMDDKSEEINGTSTQATLTDGPASNLSTAEVKWTSSPNYVNSYIGAMGAGAANTYALSTSMPSSASGTFVVEGWFNAKNATSNSNWCISSADSGGRWLFGINSGSTFSFGGENNIGIGSGWHHLAIVCDSGTKRFYYDGIYKGAWYSTNTGFSTLHIGQFNSGDANDFRGHIQDLKVTIGSNRGYTGTNSGSANFTLPSSIVESYP
jgi:hypothetical protein